MRNQLLSLHKPPKGDTKENKKIPSRIVIFQNLLTLIKDWNQELINTETIRIRDASQCSEWFDKLIKAVVKSNIVLLTSGYSIREDRIAMRGYHNSIDISHFIHLCYIYSAKRIYNDPFLYKETDIQDYEKKSNQRSILQLIDDGIREAIWHSIPIKGILDEYLELDTVIIKPLEHMNVENMQLNKIKSNIDPTGGSRVDGMIDPNSKNIQPHITKDTEQKTMTLNNVTNQQGVMAITKPYPEFIDRNSTLLKVGGELKSFHSRNPTNENVQQTNNVKISKKQSAGGEEIDIDFATEQNKKSTDENESDEEDDEESDDNVQHAVVTNVLKGGAPTTGGTVERGVNKGLRKNDVNLSEIDELEGYSNSMIYKTNNK
jgi:hypothetical protein